MIIVAYHQASTAYLLCIEQRYPFLNNPGNVVVQENVEK